MQLMDGTFQTMHLHKYNTQIIWSELTKKERVWYKVENKGRAGMDESNINLQMENNDSNQHSSYWITNVIKYII